MTGRRAAVAASSAGLGFATAAALAAEGARVALCGRDEAKLQAAAAQIGERAVPLVADVSTVAGALGFVRGATDALGGLDILVTNAGGPPPATATEATLEQHRAALEANCLGAIAMCEEALPAMRAQRWGRIVAITSLGVRQPIPTLVLSNTARTALHAFLRTLAREVAGDGVTVNSVQPGTIETDRIRFLFQGDMRAAAAAVPAGEVGQPAQFGQVAAFLCSEAAAYVTGVAIPVDGGTYSGLL